MSNLDKVMMIGTSPKARGGISSVIRSYKQSGIMERLNISYYATHCDGTCINKVIFYFKAVLRILKDVKEFQIIHIHTASWWSFRRLFPIILFGKCIDKKVIIHLHGAKFDVYFRDAMRVEQAFLKWVFKQADVVIVLSEEWRKKVSAFCSKRKIRVVPNGVILYLNGQMRHSPKLRHRKKIVFLGEIGKRKGAYDLIEAIRILNDNGFSLQCVLCGDGETEKLRKEVEKKNLSSFISIPGWVDDEEKLKLLREAYIYILPSYHEGMPMSILEAMGTGLPVISTPVGGIPEVVEDGYNGFLVPPGRPDALARRIRKLYENEDLWVEMSKNSLKTVEHHFSMQRIERKLSGIYEDLLKKWHEYESV